MILKYGTRYTSYDGECELTISKMVWYDDAHRRRGYIEKWNIRGRLMASGADLEANLTTQLADLETQFGANGHDLTLYESDGVTETAHKLDSSAGIDGVRIESISYPRGSGAQYATHRDYEIVASLRVEDASNDVLAYTETISVMGTGGSAFVLRQPLRGRPIKQGVATHTPVRIIQQGSAVGRTAYPTFPRPLYPADLINPSRMRSRKAPKRYNNSYREYEITWSYEMIRTIRTGARSPDTWL